MGSHVKKILCILVVAVLVVAGCNSKEATSLDSTLLINNVNGYSMTDKGLQQFGAILIDAGKVVATGATDSLNQQTSNPIIDAGGKTMLPGLIDAHGHVLGLGKLRMEVDLVGAQSIEEALQRIADFAAANPELPWIIGQGWNQVFWPGKEYPTALDLDSLNLGKPVWMERVDGHAGWANSAAMEIGKVTAETVSPAGGEIITNDDGTPSGIFIDLAMPLVVQHLPPTDDAALRRALQLSQAETSSLGLTSVHDAGVHASLIPLFKEFADKDQLPTRLYTMLGGEDEFDQFQTPLASYADDKLSVRSVKLYADGALGSRGAAMIAPYNDREDSRGLLFESQQDMNRMVSKIHAAGFQVNVHAIGDLANQQVLNAFAELGPQANARMRHRIEHAQVIDIDDLKRFSQLNIIASMQPTHATSDMNMAEDRVGAARIKGAYAWKTLLQDKARIAAGSDFPVESANPFWGLHAAVTRQNQRNEPAGGWYKNEAMSREQALYTFTLGAAYAAHQDEILGSLEPGKWADFIFIDQDYFKIAEDKIWQIEVLETWQAGRQVYQKP